MAVVVNSGFTETAKLMIGGTASAFKIMALGTDSYADAVAQTKTALSALITENSGLSAATATTAVANSAVTGDTSTFEYTWTSTKVTTVNVKECGVFNKIAATDTMLCYGTFANAIPMESGDTLKVSWSVQVKGP